MIVVFVLAVVALAPSKINYVCFVILGMIVIQGSYKGSHQKKKLG